jgi:hypothetical protein
VNRFGRGFNPPASANPITAAMPAPVNGVSIVLCFSRSGATQSISVGFNGDSTTRCQAHIPFSDGNVYWDFGGTSFPNRLTLTGRSNYDGTWVLTAGANGMRIFLNGRLLTSSTTTVTRTDFGPDYFGLGNGIAPGDTGAVYDLFHCEGRQFPDAYALSVSANPWQMFEPIPHWPLAPAPAAAAGFFARPYYDMIGQSRIGS